MSKQLLLLASLFAFLLLPSFAKSQADYNAEIKQAAISFVNSLDKMHMQVALLAFNDTARIKWNNLPVGLRARAGISVGNMTVEQRKLFHRILSVSLSSQGYLKATSIMQLDNLLNQYYDSLYYGKEIDSTTYGFIRALQWSPRNYYLAFFENPSDSVWGYKVEGHHLSVNFTFVKDKLSVTPFFVGTDPAEYPMG